MFLILIVVCVDIALGQQCFHKQEDFEAACATTYKGVVEGNSCFFPLLTQDNWDASWTTCQNKGGQMAQIHTSSELGKISAFLQNNPSPLGYFWLALQSNNDGTYDCTFPLNDTYWYNGPNSYDSGLLLNNTWLRDQHCFDASLNGRCTILYNGYANIGDNPCELSRPPLCQMYNTHQRFVETKDVCILEKPIEEATQTTSYDCSQLCSSRMWCRSFNMINGDTCQMFTWSLKDNPRMEPGNAACSVFSTTVY